VDPVPLRRNRDFMVLWCSQVVSTVGARVTSIAYPLLVLAVTHSPAEAGVVGFTQTLPFLLLYLPAGAFIDRWDRKRTMLACDAGRAVALGSIAVTVALGWLSMAQVVVVALIDGSLFVLFDLAEGAALPQLVTKEQLQTAFGAQTTLLILSGIMCAVATAATLARGMRQLPTPSPVRKHRGNFPRHHPILLRGWQVWWSWGCPDR
jgi:MFS family permease